MFSGQFDVGHTKAPSCHCLRIFLGDLYVLPCAPQGNGGMVSNVHTICPCCILAKKEGADSVPF
jgi:hypothetical protein